MKHERSQNWRQYAQLIRKSHIPWVLIIGYFLIGIAYSRISADLIPFSSKIYTGEILDFSQITQYILLVVLMLLVWFAQCITQYWTSYKIERQFQLTAWKSIVRMPMGALEKNNAATLPSRITSDPTKLSNQFLVITAVLTSLYSIWITLENVRRDSAYVADLMWKLLLVLCVWILLSGHFCGRFKFRAAFRSQETYASFTDYITERLSNISLIKTSATEDSEVERAMEEINSQYRASIYYINVEYISNFVKECANYIFQALVLFICAMLVREGSLDQAGMLTAYRYSLTLPVYLTTVTTAYLSIKDGQGSAARISEIVSSAPEQYAREKSFSMEDADITFENVSFSYGDKHVLNHAAFKIAANQVTAVIGPNGSGKSTIAKLLERYYTPQEGMLRFGACPVEDIHLNEWREAIGYISQDTVLISGTLRDNLVYALNRPVEELELWQALKGANLERFARALPDGLDTNIGELGNKLSGGERQRIGIARVILRNPEYLILDEVTSSLDPENKSAVMHALQKLMRGRTCLIISHDMDVVKEASTILVLENGSVIASGNHEELLKSSEFYKRCVTLSGC